MLWYTARANGGAMSDVARLPATGSNLEKVLDKLEKSKQALANLVLVGKPTARIEELKSAIFGGEESFSTDQKSSIGSFVNILTLTTFDKPTIEHKINLFQNDLENNTNSDIKNSLCHIAWVIIGEFTQESVVEHIKVIRVLNALKIPVLIVLWLDPAKKAVIEGLRAICAKADVTILGICALGAASHSQSADYQPLLVQTYQGLPEACRSSFAAAQRLDTELKRSEARGYVDAAAEALGQLEETAVPFSEMVAIVPIQVTMIMGISRMYGFKFSRGAVIPMVTAIAGSSGLTIAGRAVASSLLKFIPGAGAKASEAIAAKASEAPTRGFGGLYIKFIDRFFERHGRHPTLGEITDLFPEFWKNRKQLDSAEPNREGPPENPGPRLK